MLYPAELRVLKRARIYNINTAWKRFNYANIPYLPASILNANTMKNLITITIISLFIVPLTQSCKKNEACVQGDETVYLNREASWTFCGQAKLIRWEVFDGSETSTQSGEELTSITHTFSDYTQDATVKVYAEEGFNRGEDNTMMSIAMIANTTLKVEDENGNAVAGATLNFYSSQACFDASATDALCRPYSWTTDADGLVTLDDVVFPLDAFIAEVIAPEFKTNWSTSGQAYTFTLADFAEGGEVVFDCTNDGLYYLMTGTWKLTNMTQGGVSRWDSQSECRKDDYISFDRDLNWQWEEGSDACNPPLTAYGTFTPEDFTGDIPSGMDVDITKDGGNLAITESSFDISLGKFSFEATADGGITTYTYHFERQ